MSSLRQHLKHKRPVYRTLSQHDNIYSSCAPAAGIQVAFDFPMLSAAIVAKRWPSFFVSGMRWSLQQHKKGSKLNIVCFATSNTPDTKCLHWVRLQVISSPPCRVSFSATGGCSLPQKSYNSRPHIFLRAIRPQKCVARQFTPLT